ncbi:MAG TPA: 4'-phosphopantetheinyl transferase superfamily protein [Xanthomonadaceae bacterium]|nr:4'-phosphopantetheinyl transferase superfamily protein [Xanthomonadaceae bacterium]
MDAGRRLPLGPGQVELWWFADATGRDRQRRARIDARLRQVLARYRGIAPASLRFAREPRGRPFLADGAGPEFNLSDTRGGTLIAVSAGARIGVDLERTDRQPSHRALARRYFAPGEARALQGLGEDEARQAFLALWTAKEAACKATGTGIYGRLDAWRFVVGVEPPQLLAAPPEAGDRSLWRFLRLAPDPLFTAVLASPGPLAQVRWQSGVGAD